MKNKEPLLSICLPCYEMGGKGHIFLKESLDILSKQSFKDFEVVISDYSKDSVIKSLCKQYAKKLRLQYVKNNDPRVGMSSNTNNAITHATGKLVKILFQDDFLYGKDALKHIVKNFDLKKDVWQVSACIHTDDGKSFVKPHYPKYVRNIQFGNNQIGSPSVLTLRRDKALLFDYHLKWLVDCDYYKRLHHAYGKPKILNTITVAIRTGDHQITNTEATRELRAKEYAYVKEKYSGKLKLDTVSVVSVSGLNPDSGIKALQLSMRGIDFHEAIMIGHNPPAELPEGIVFKKCRPSDLKSRDRKNTNDYSKFMLYRLHEYINSDYALIVHKNAHVLRPYRWSEEFLKYDYIGAPWPATIHFTPEGENVRVGNGGFSLRSKKLLNALNELKLPFTDNDTGFFHEDGVICVYYRKQLEEYGIKFAPVEVAARFALEIRCPESDMHPFGFHDNPRALPLSERLSHYWKKMRGVR